MTRFAFCWTFAFCCCLVVSIGCRPTSPDQNAEESPAVAQAQSESRESLQTVIVFVPDPQRSEAVVQCVSRANVQEKWADELPEMPALIGRNGLAEPGRKKEGDGKTPQGEYGIVSAFGREAEPPPSVVFPYRQATENDYWIDDPASPDYNRWVSGDRPTVSHERLRLADDVPAYDFGLTLDYNTDPVVPDAGSAIFLHVWLDEHTPTSGCVALSRENVLEILRWLDPAKHPRIRIEARPE